VNPLRRAARKARYLYESWLVERLLAEGLAPVLAPRLYRPCKRLPPGPEAVRSVLVWNVDSIGDFLWITPTLRALRAGYRHAAITLVCNRACRELAETNPHVDRLIPIDPQPFYTGRGLLRRVPELTGGSFDVMVILEMGSRPADAARVLGRRLGVGFVASSDLGLLKSLPDYTLPPNQAEYWAAYFLRLVEHLGLSPGRPDLEVTLTPDDLSAAGAVFGRDDDRVAIGFHPYVAQYARLTKKWPDDSFIDLARLLAARRPTRFILTGSTEEADECQQLAVRIRAVTGEEVLSTAGRLPLRAVVALNRRLRVVVTGDTAALHLAAAAGVPTVSLFGATDDRRIAPPSPHCVVLNQRLPCSPCHRYTDRRPVWPSCIFDRPKCLHDITPQAVAEAIQKFLNRKAPLK
jgi:heptosyltransferase-2